MKEKRRILKSILPRLRKTFNVSAAEVEYHDVWQTAVIALSNVGNESAHLHRVLEKAVSWIESNRPDVPIDTYSIEFW